MIGINFELDCEYNSFLSKIFSGVDLGKFSWIVPYEEILYGDASSIFDREVMDGASFKGCIEKDHYYLIFAEIKAFPVGVRVRSICTYDDFVKSNCELALFCTDVAYVEVYCKSETLLRTIIQNCKQFGFSNVEVLTRDDKIRTRFSILPG